MRLPACLTFVDGLIAKPYVSCYETELTALFPKRRSSGCIEHRRQPARVSRFRRRPRQPLQVDLFDRPLRQRTTEEAFARRMQQLTDPAVVQC